VRGSSSPTAPHRLVRSPRIAPSIIETAARHNVALINSIAHVICRRAVKEDFVRERCEILRSRMRTFVSLEKNSPRPCRRSRGSAETVRGRAAVCYGGNGHLLRPRRDEHSQGSTMVMGIANLAMATGNVGREVWASTAARQNNVQGSATWGRFHTSSGLSPCVG